MANPKEIMKLAESDLDGDSLCSVKLCRKDGSTLLYVQADEKITDLMHNGTLSQSTSWNPPESEDGFNFYQRQNYNSAVSDALSPFYDDFGSNPVNRGTSNPGNIAFLRAEGVKDGIFFEIKEPITEEYLREMVKSIKKAVDVLKDQFIKDVAFIGEIREIQVDNTVQTAFPSDEENDN